jgi:hypothetical protein
VYERRAAEYQPAPRGPPASTNPAAGARASPACIVRVTRVTTLRVLSLLVVAVAGSGAPAHGDPVRVRFPEGPAHGFVVLASEDGRPLAHGELEQWLEGNIVASRLVFRFDDGSLYDELVRFSQRRVFRLDSYHLVQSRPALKETLAARF